MWWKKDERLIFPSLMFAYRDLKTLSIKVSWAKKVNEKLHEMDSRGFIVP